jgi:co-chaperonin GroES (HSP10)
MLKTIHPNMLLIERHVPTETKSGIYVNDTQHRHPIKYGYVLQAGTKAEEELGGIPASLVAYRPESDQQVTIGGKQFDVVRFEQIELILEGEL